MKKKSVVGWISRDFIFKDHFYIDRIGSLNVCKLWKKKSDAIDHYGKFWNHSGKVKKVRITISDT